MPNTERRAVFTPKLLSFTFSFELWAFSFPAFRPASFQAIYALYLTPYTLYPTPYTLYRRPSSEYRIPNAE